jgi:RNA polymerase sigma-70 factor (ECF subfamily)
MAVHERAAAQQAEIEAVYRARFDQFVHVASAVTGNLESGADAVQDAFARALRHAGGYRSAGSLEAWLWRIVINSAHDRRTRQHELLSEQSLAAVEGVGEDDAVRRAVAQLPERQRLVLFLRYFADLDYASIAHVLGISRGTVSATLHKAHAALRTQLEQVSPP